MEFKFIPYALDKKDEPIGFFSNLSLLISDLQNLQDVFGGTFTVNNLIVNIDATIGNDLDVGNNLNVDNDATVGGKLSVTGGVVGDVYQPDGTTLALDNLTPTIGLAGAAVGTPLLYGRSIDSTTRTGVSAAIAGNINAAAAASLNGRFGYVGIQTYAINNSILMENAWFDGSAFKYIANGSASRMYLLDGIINFDFAPSGTAGATAVFQNAFTVDSSGDAEVANSLTVNNKLNVTSDTQIDGDLTATNNLYVYGNLEVGQGIIGDVYQPDGVTLALDNLTSTLGNAGAAVGTPLLYGRSIDSTTRTGVSVAIAGSVNAAAAASLNGRFGYVGIQTYAINNSFIMENAWFDGSAFKYIANGSAGRLYFLDGEINFDFAPSGSAGATAVFQKSVTIAGNGDIYTAKESILSSGTIAASDIKKGIVKVDVSLGSVLINLPTGSDLDVQFPKMDIGECYQFMLYPTGSAINAVELVDATGCVCQSAIGTSGRKALYPRMVILRKIGTASYEIY